jgi:hypothetical protein
MSECWQDGDLRAALDRELPAEEMERLTAHVAECGDCGARQKELARRAGTVSLWMDDLAESAPIVVPMPVRRTAWRKWAVAGLAAAACLAIAMVAIARRTGSAGPMFPQQVTALAPPSVALGPVAASVPEVAPAPRMRSAAAVSRPALRVRRGKSQQVEQFIALDSEPFETGLVVRVALGPDEVQADVVFSPDGRARAYRLVNEKLN